MKTITMTATNDDTNLRHILTEGFSSTNLICFLSAYIIPFLFQIARKVVHEINFDNFKAIFI